MKTVIKRDGSKKPFDNSKIKKQLEFAYTGLKENQLELEAKLTLNFKNNMKTSDIQDLLVSTATSMIDQDHPEMSIVAGRLSMYQLHRQVYKNTKFEYDQFDEYIKYAVRTNHYRKDIMKPFSEEDIKTIKKAINPKYDFDMNIAQVLSLRSKYILKNSRGVIEYPQFSDMASSMILGGIEDESERVKKTKEYFTMLQRMYISLATPFKSNLRREGGNVGSCFIVPTLDNIESITKTWQDMAKISKEGGGIGVYLGGLRPEGSYSDNIPNANNIIRWAKIINDIAVAVNQRGIRKGAITPALDWWHGDIHSFIEMKSETQGDLRNKCFDLFPQVVVDDYFVDAVLKNKDVYLFDSYEVKTKTGIDIVSLIDEELYKAQETIYDLCEKGTLTNCKKENAKALWKEFLRIWVETGDFYITHKDNLNLCNYLKGEDLIANSANLCVSGDTKILTKQGYVDIESVSGQTIEVWNGTEWSMSELFKTSDDDELVTVSLSNNQTINATLAHRWLVVQDDSRKAPIIKRTEELSVGDRLAKFDLPVLSGDKVLPLAYENGFFSGDGSQDNNGIQRIYLYHEKRALVNNFSGYTSFNEDEAQNRTTISYTRLLKDRFFIPTSDYTLESRLKWLAGIMDSDGTLTNDKGSESIQFASVNEIFINNLMLFLQEMGINSKVQKVHNGGERKLPLNNGSSDKKEYTVKPLYRLLIAGSECIKLLDLGYKAYRVMPTMREYNRSAIRFVTVKNIDRTGLRGATYCGNEPKNHTLMFNGVMTMNCTESFSVTKAPTEWVQSYKNGVMSTESDGLYHSCNLLSINLGLIVNDPEDKLLKRVCYNAVDMMDASIETGTMPVKEAENSSKLLRNVGIGVLGTGDWMAYNKLSYEKPEDLDELEKVYEKIAWYCYERSVQLAEKKGAYPLFDKADYSKMFGKNTKQLDKESLNGFKWSEMSKKIQEKGIRNFLLLATAPNCQSGHNKMKTTDGNKSIYDILEEQNIDYRKIEELNVPQWIGIDAIKVPTLNGESEVNRIWYNGKQPVIEIEFEDGNTYEFTYNHKLLVYRNGEEIWIRCDELKEGDDIININEKQ